MKKFRMKACLLLTLILGVFILPGCGGDAGNGHWDKPVTDATLVSIMVTPVTDLILVGGSKQYRAMAIYSSGAPIDVTANSLTVWSLSNNTGNHVSLPVTNGNGAGLANGLIATPVGSPVTITATYGVGGPFGSAELTVTDATVESIIVEPDIANILVNGTQPYKATAILSDGSTLVVTTDPGTVWSSDDTGVATFVLPPVVDGIATGLAIGTANITATYNTITSPSVVLNVTAAVAASCAGPGPVDMGAASSFGVLVGPAGGATLTITNPTTVNGDVGAASYIPAVGPSTLVGTQYTGVDGPYLNAKAAMLSAIACASSRPCSPGLAFNIGADHDFGGDVLDPGVYCVAGGMSVGSPLTLTNPGVYVFRSSGDLTTADTITMTFGGTANATNTSVFWVPTGAATIGADNAFLGTIMPEASAATTLGANTTLLGRVLSNSDVNLDNNTITVP